MGTIGPKENPKPLILHVDSDTGIPYRLAESDILVVGTISATNYQNLTLTSIGGVTSIEQLAGTGIFATTGQLNSYLLTSVAQTTYLTQSNAAATYATQTSLGNYAYLGSLTATFADGDILYYDNAAWQKLSVGSNGQVLTVGAGLPTWDSPCGTVSIPVEVAQGGTGTTTQTNNGVLYYNGTDITSEAGFTYNEGTDVFTVNTINTATPIGVQYGGTNATSIENARTNLGLGTLATLNSPLPLANGGTNFTGPYTSEGVLYFDGTRLQADAGFTYKATTDTATLGSLTLNNALTVPNGGTGRTTLTVGHFLVGNGAGSINSVATGTFETTSNAANTYFNKTTDTLAVNRGGTNNATAPTNRGVIFYDSTKYDANTTLKLGTTYKLLAACGVAVPSKKLFIEDGNDNPTTQFKLKDIYDVTTTPAGNGQVLTYSTGTDTWGPADLPAGLATPISISNGGTNTTGPFLSNGVVYFDQTLTSFKSSSNLTFNGTTLTANQISLNTPLSVANGGTNTTGPFTSNGIIYFNGTRVATESAFTYTESTNTLSTDTLALTNALTVANGGTGLKTIPAGRFLVGDGTNPITTVATGTFETTSNAANTYLEKSANVTSLNGTGVFETTAYSRNNFLLNSTNVTSLNGTGVFDTTANATNYFNKNTDTLPITRGGTNATGPFLSNGVLYFDQSLTSFKSNSNLTFNGTILTANQLSLNTALSVANGGTGRTTLVTGALYANSTTSIDVAQGLTDLEIFADDSNLINSYTNYGAIPIVGTDGRYIKTLCTTATIGKYLGNYLVTSIAGINFVGPRWEDLTLTSLKDVSITSTAGQSELLAYDTGVSKWKPLSVVPLNRGGTNATTADNALTNLGGTTVGKSFFTLTNPGAERFVKITNANAVQTRTATEMKSDLGIVADTWTTVVKTENEDKNDNTLSVDNELYFNIPATGVAHSFLYSIFFSADSSDGFSYDLYTPGTVQNCNYNITYSPPNNGANFENTKSKSGNGLLGRVNAATDFTGNGHLLLQGVVSLSVTGDFYIRHSKEVTGAGASNLTIFKGSYLRHATVS